MAANECTFRLASSWPSAGFEVGHGYVYFHHLAGTNSTAFRVNITCPADDWGALSAASPLQPCGTALVSTGTELINALNQLQQGHERLLITLTANISLPTAPTPQRVNNHEHDRTPLVRVSRNTTLVGGYVKSISLASSVGGSTSGMVRTELDMALRRNAFSMLREDGSVDTGGNRGGATLIFSDLTMVNAAPGPPSSWPAGMLGVNMYMFGYERTRPYGHFFFLRVNMVSTALQTRYIGYYYTLARSMRESERLAGAWVFLYVTPSEVLLDEARMPVVHWASDGIVERFNSTALVTPLRTVPTDYDYEPWALDDPPPPAANVTGGAASIAAVRDAAELLSWLQMFEADKSRSRRAAVLLNNITLASDAWPQGGVNVTYDLSVAGPNSGAPVWLDLGGKVLATVPPGRLVVLRNLHVRNLPLPPFMLTRLAGAEANLPSHTAYTPWASRCSAGASDQDKAWRYEVYNCVCEIEPGLLELIRRYNMEGCASAPGTGTGTAGCGATRLPAAWDSLLRSALKATGQVNASTGETVALVDATFAGGNYTQSTYVSSIGSSSAGGEGGANADAVAMCTLQSLYLLGTSGADGAAGKGKSRAAAIAGSVVGGVVAAALALGAVVACLVVGRRHRRAAQQSDPEVGAKLQQTDSEKVDMQAPSSSDGRPGNETSCAPASSGAKGGASVVKSASLMAPGAPCAGDDAGKDNGQQAEATHAEAMGLDSPDVFPEAMISQLTAFSASDSQVSTLLGRLLMGGPGEEARRPQPGSSAGARALAFGATFDTPTSGRGAGAVQPAHEAAKLLLASEIHDMMNTLQASTPSSSQAGGRNARMGRLLGRGAYGSVHQALWRGLPVAAKVLLLQHSDSAARRERLVREVALSATLSHPNVVPTYGHTLQPVMAAGQGGAGGAEPGSTGPKTSARHSITEDGAACSGYDGDDEVVAFRMCIYMQLCDGGSLREALIHGMFRETPRPLPASPQRVPGVSTGCPGQERQPAPQCAIANGDCSMSAEGSDPGAGSSEAGDGAAAATAALPAGTGPGVLQLASVPLDGTCGGFPPFQCQQRYRSWDDVTLAANLPLALLAAADLLCGLAYLHGCGVIHGDFNDNNVLLMSAEPVLPSSPADRRAAGPPTPATAAQPMARAHGSTASPAGSGPLPRPLHAEEQGPEPDRRSAPLHAAARPRPPSEGVPAVAAAGSSTCSTTGGSSGMSSSTGCGAHCSTMASLPRPASNTAECELHLPRAAPAAALRSGSVGASGPLPAAPSLELPGPEAGGTEAARAAAGALLRHVFKISDMGLSILAEPDKTHVSMSPQGTPFFTCPVVLTSGKLSTASDMYGFGVVLWSLLHGVQLSEVRHLLPPLAYVSVSASLLEHTAPGLPPAARALLRACMAAQPADRPTAVAALAEVEGLLRAVAGPGLSGLLLATPRRERHAGGGAAGAGPCVPPLREAARQAAGTRPAARG